ncbi:transcriptional regulator [Clostridium bowmanii]|uniref:ArsR/SmtB family transcription factor n=1 Tax=Clostridium bowmanii TaxID=132925 RepID=UPI001C0ADDC9|nr:transcriptional regulator [Clostridium bowmanii]MBU3189618.1 transcriptional regulator [Clostridium bowmanii]MCA1073538.1 transcriptional regulator [Clostridium bowmanii]
MLELSFTNEADLIKVCHALSTNIRVDILKLIMDKNLSVVEIAKTLNIPVSTAASNITLLEKSGLILTELHPAKRGAMKICSQNFDGIHINLDYCDYSLNHVLKYNEIEMPIGHYINCEVYPTCGLSDETKIITLDDPSTFFTPSRINAEVLWFRRGFVDYKFPKMNVEKNKVLIHALEFSMEICSEAPGVNNNWPSDITFYLNDKELVTWTSPGDFGDVRGKLNPSWWPDFHTQYGLLKHIKIDNNGSYLDEELLSSMSLKDLQLEKSAYITLRIAIKDNANNKGGVTILGKHFGNTPQDIIMRTSYNEL